MTAGATPHLPSPRRRRDRVTATIVVIGLATTRYVMANPAVADMSRDELIRFARPVIRRILVEPIDA